MRQSIPIHFAPLQGYTEAPYRNMHALYFGGIDTYYTPFVRLEKGEFRRKDLRDIEPDHNQVPHLVPQLLASEMDKAEAILALFIEKGYKEVDINMGCPFPLLAKRHNGSGILPYPEEMAALLSIVERHPEISFSVKMRLGWEQAGECLNLLPLLNELPLKHITLHPRLGKQQYKGTVDMQGFTAFYENCRIPLIHNGDLMSVEDIEGITTCFPRLAGIMIGRGLLANPALAYEYNAGKTLSTREMSTKLQAMHTALYQYYEQRLEGEKDQLLNKMKTFWEYLLPEADRKQKKAIHKCTNLARYKLAVSLLLNEMGR